MLCLMVNGTLVWFQKRSSCNVDKDVTHDKTVLGKVEETSPIEKNPNKAQRKKVVYCFAMGSLCKGLRLSRKEGKRRGKNLKRESLESQFQMSPVLLALKEIS